MSEFDPKNIYEAVPDSSLDQERARLRSFDLPTQVSVQAIGSLDNDSVLLDVGSGENPGLKTYAQAEGARYIAIDIRPKALTEQHDQHAIAVQADARTLPIAESVIDVAPSRFVLAHFTNKEDRKKIVKEAFRVVTPGGKAVFIDYDWTAMRGSSSLIRLRDFTLGNISIFDAGYGVDSKQEIGRFLDNKAVIEELRVSPPILQDYESVLALRQVTLRALRQQTASQNLIDEANAIFDGIQAESTLENPPGFHMPDMVGVICHQAYSHVLHA